MTVILILSFLLSLETGDKMVTLKAFEISAKNTIDSEDMKGKRVIAEDGHVVGDVDSFLINPVTLSIESLKVTKGLFSSEYFIGRNYIDKVGKDGVILNITPSEEFVGKKVYNIEAEELGEVKEIKRMGNTNDIVSIVVDTGIGKDDIEITSDEIKEIGKNFIVEKSK